MQFDTLSIFPQAFESYFSVSIMARAQAKGFIKIKHHNLRQFTTDKHHTVDDRPYGGGSGMVMKSDVVQKALKSISAKKGVKKQRVILLTPQGKTFKQSDAKRLSQFERLVFISGRYEGYDERIRLMVDEEFSIGDYVLSGGELPAMVIMDSVSRLLPGVVGKEDSLAWESFSKIKISTPELKKNKAAKEAKKLSTLLEYPQYTRPAELKIGHKIFRVPRILLSGAHKEIFEWRLKQALSKTKKRRPDLR